MTDADLRAACQQIVAHLRARLTPQIRAELVEQAEAALYGSSWLKRGVGKARKRRAQPKQTRRYQRRDGGQTVPQRLLNALDRREFSAVGLANETGITLPIVRTTLTRLTREGRVTHNGSRPALYSLPMAAQAAE